MKKLLPYIFILISSALLLTACVDDTFNSKTLADGQVGLKLALNLPGGGSSSTRAGGTDAEEGTESEQGYENWLQANDIRLLLFTNERFTEEVTNLQITGLQGNNIRYLEGTTNNPYNGNLTIVVLANLKSRGVVPTTDDFKDKTIEEVYRLLDYTYGDDAWTVNEENRIPMWGSIEMYIQQGKINVGHIDLYRSIAKVNLLVHEGEGLDHFELRSIYVYFANGKGYCAPLPTDAIAENEEVQFTRTSIPASNTQSGVDSPLTYSLEEGATTFKNRIYIPESNNKQPRDGEKPLCLVVGGVYAGDGLVEQGEESYYRIDFKDDLESQDKEDLRTYDVIRNHAYVFNIRSVSRPGTTTPEEALDNVVVGMDVSIEEWINDFMRGIPDQYTLTTDKSVVTFDPFGNDPTTNEPQTTVDVWTDYEFDATIDNGTWTIEDINAVEKGFSITKNDKNQVVITATENNGVSKTAYFYVAAGNIKKQIIIKQKQPITANCYVVGDGEHTLIVNIKGNGNDGIYAVSDKGLGNVKLVEANQEDASIRPDKIGIIWETKAGLVTLIQPNGTPVSSGKGMFAQFDKAKGTIQYKVNTSGASIGGVQGGNALIGAFAENGTLLWSWHIWACPNMVEEASNKGIKNTCVQNWSLNGYEVIDRNLGALSNQPGVASMGLLYQWGRKDPFIGAKYTNDNYPKNDTGVLETEWYYEDWGVDANSNRRAQAIPYTIQHPTKLIQAGLSKSGENRSSLLWGTDGGLNKEGVKDLGSKTIYDPCPEGYRVPPVDAFVFKTDKVVKDYITSNELISQGIRYFSYTPTSWRNGNKSSETVNWNDNLIYIPHRVTGRGGQNPNTYYNGGYIHEAAYYGFYLNYSEIIEPVLTTDYKTGGKQQYYFYKPKANEKTLTWLPLSGAYNPNQNRGGLTFKGVTIEQGSSITVNSFLWTNSSVKNGTEVIPAAMFLHGTEVYSEINGRHIHGLTLNDIKAEPQYAGSVRCVRDIQKDFSESNSVPATIELNKAAGSITEGKVISINDTWRVIDPGASWLNISPDKGVADKGRGTTVNFTAAKTNNTGSSRTTTVLIKFTNESQARPIKVTQTAR